MAKMVKKKVTTTVIKNWAKSKKAKSGIERAFKRSEKTIAFLRSARKIDPETLDKPITM